MKPKVPRPTRGGRAVRRKACTGKIRYNTLAEARAEARIINQRYNDTLSPYHCLCHGCGAYHLGHR